MLLADAELEGQPVGDVLAALADQLGGAEQDLLTLVTGQLRLVGGCDFKGAPRMLGRAGRHRADHLVGIGIMDFDNLVGMDDFAANAHALVTNILTGHPVMLRVRLLRCRDRGIVKGVEIAKFRRGRKVDLTVDDEGNFLFGQPAMAAKRLFQRSQVMPVLGRADGDLLVRNDDDIADPVGRKLETPHSLVTADHQHDAVDGVQPGHDFADIASLRKIGGGE